MQEVAKSSEKARNWVFTLNNYTEADIKRLANPFEHVKYVAYGKEIAPETGTPHLQGYVCCWTPVRMSFFKKQLPRAHMEVMQGRLLDNDRYIEKEGDFTTWGQKPDQGRRTDLVGLKRKIEEGHHPMDLALDDEGFTTVVGKHERFANSLYQHHRGRTMQTDREKPEVYIRIGPAGTGKSRWLDEQYGLSGWVEAPDNTGKWFDKCDSRPVVVFNDVDCNSRPPLDVFKKITDRYPTQRPVKGGFIWFKPKTIVFTSNSHPFEWWSELTDNDKAAITRRITKIEWVM